MRVRVFASIVAAFLILSVLPGAPGHTVRAQQPGPTLSVEPALLLADIAPGGEQTYTVTVKSSIDTMIDVTPSGMGQTPDGGFEILSAAQDTSAYSARSYIRAAPDRFHLAPGASQPVTVTLSVPADPGDGGRYAVLRFLSASGAGPGSDQNVGVGASIGASVIVTLEGKRQDIAGKITDVTVNPIDPKQPVQVTTRLQNTGNYHYGYAPRRMWAGATLIDAAGNTVAAATSPFSDSSVVPTFSRDFQIDVAPQRTLAAGKYKLTIEAGLEDGTVLDTTSKDIDLTSEVLGINNGGGTGWGWIAGGTGGGVLLIVLLAAVIIARRRRRQRQLEVIS